MLDPVRYQPGSRINTRRPLEIIDLAADSPHWVQIGNAYPEVANAGPEASFRGAHNVTIFPPEIVSQRTLKMLASITGPHHVYPLKRNERVIAVLVHVAGGYASLHVYQVHTGL